MKFGFTPESFYEDTVKNLPLSKILLETDGPYFLPKKIETKRPSLPSDVWFIAQQVAYFKNVTVTDVLVSLLLIFIDYLITTGFSRSNWEIVNSYFR